MLLLTKNSARKQAHSIDVVLTGFEAF